MHCQCHVPRYLCVIFDINYHHYMSISISLDTAHPKLRPDKHARGMCIVLTYSYGKFNCDRLHIVITFIYINTPLLTSTYKPVLARAPSSLYIISEETSIFAPQRLPFYKALGVAAFTVGKVRASTVFMCVCSTFRSPDFFYYSSKTDSWWEHVR